MRLRLLYIMLFTLLLSLSSVAWACPMCRESLPNSTSVTNADGTPASGQPATAEGFAYSIYLMLAVPYAMVAGVGGYIYFRVRAHKARNLPVTA